jgi:hypothetical protein
VDIHSIYRLILPFFRKRRFRHFTRTFHLNSETTLMDIGGYRWQWEGQACPARITVVNTHMPERQKPGSELRLVQGDGTRLPFADKAFEIGYSNSVIEHLSTLEAQQRFAEEICRVARGVWVQTPARWFVIEPHLLTPLIHYLPKSWQKPLLRYGSVWGWITKPTPAQVQEFLDEVRLLTFSEMQTLFPDCEIRRERFCLLTKSFIAVRKASGPANLQPSQRPQRRAEGDLPAARPG